MRGEGVNIDDVNASRVNVSLVCHSTVNASLEFRMTGGISPSPGGDDYVLRGALLLDGGGVMLADGGIPLLYGR